MRAITPLNNRVLRPPALDWLRLVAERANSITFGKIEITVHDGQVTQIDKSERIRLEQSPVKSASFGPNNRTTD
jgi:hypothetical protein